jgi:hypothetical protein
MIDFAMNVFKVGRITHCDHGCLFEILKRLRVVVDKAAKTTFIVVRATWG